MAQRSFTILEADGQYNDNILEDQIFASERLQGCQVRFIRGALAPVGFDTLAPWTDIPEDIRNEVDGLMILKVYVTREDIALFPKLKVIVRCGVGYDRIDRMAAAERGIVVCNVPDYGTEEIADHAIGLALSMRRGILLHHDLQRGPTPAPWMHVEHPLVARLQRATFGILGLGRIGTAAALRAKAFGWNVLFYDPFLPNGADKALGIERTKDLEELYRRSSTLSIHCPNNRATQGSVTYDYLKLMPRGAVLVNTARGEIVDLDAVERCLKEGILAGAALDVLPIEPIPEDNVHPLIKAYRDKDEWLIGRLVLTSHTAFYSPSSLDEIRSKSAETMRDVLIHSLKANVISPDME